MFSWNQIHREAIGRILEYRLKQDQLIAVLRDMAEQRLKVISLRDKAADGQEIPLAEIDPFTFLASFNRGVTDQNRRDGWKFLKSRWQLAAPVPEDFAGIPFVDNRSSWFFPYAEKREQEHVGLLWQLAAQAVQEGLSGVEGGLFDRCLKLRRLAIGNLTIGLFWINPDQFLPADHKTLAYGAAKGVIEKPTNHTGYLQWIGKMSKEVGGNYSQISHDAHVFATQVEADGPRAQPAPPSQPRRYWTLSAGTGGEQWEDFKKSGIAAIGWDGTPDLSQFGSKEEIREKLQELWPGGSSKTNDAHACWQFVHDIHIGDIIFAKQGVSRLLGFGEVAGDYEFDNSRPHYKHVRTVKWLAKGQWKMPKGGKMALKTLTDITPYPEFVELIAGRVGLQVVVDPNPIEDRTASSAETAYWWLNANPRIWDFEDTPVGGRQTYTSHNAMGNKRQKYRHFQQVKTGDLVIGYVTSPLREVVAVCKITQGLHQTGEGEGIEFEKVEQLSTPVAYETLQAHPDLAEAEPLINNQGGLFRLTEQEYGIIRSLIDDTNVLPPIKIVPYDKKQAMGGLFLPEARFDEMLAALREKKNVVLQGAPGVGKTFVAKRLAFALIGSDDPQRVEMIQFHQSYSYEDFIQGFRPTAKGHFDLRYGIFHQFCRRAQRGEAESKPYVFIIDEINRGNLSKIFGELMMLIEADKRGKEHAMPLAYAQDPDDRFYIPENLHLVGMMNTADRSLAMVDYALRRRFRFITLEPEFSSEPFRDFLLKAGAKPDLVRRIVSRMNALNEVIAADAKNLGPGYRIGHSYFCPRNGIQPDEDWYRRVIEAEIAPLIQEYWFDNEQKVQQQSCALLA